jgi:hypothetical protein
MRHCISCRLKSPWLDSRHTQFLWFIVLQVNLLALDHPAGPEGPIQDNNQVELHLKEQDQPHGDKMDQETMIHKMVAVLFAGPFLVDVFRVILSPAA